MSDVYCVRAEFGKYTQRFVSGGYVAIGWLPGTDLSSLGSKRELYPLYINDHPGLTNKRKIGTQVGQIARFLLKIKGGDYVVTPAAEAEWLHYGEVGPEPSYFYHAGDDGCPYRHRRRVEWASEPLKRSDFSGPFWKAMCSRLSVFAISQPAEFFLAVGQRRPVRGVAAGGL